jgi:hypothetical protein
MALIWKISNARSRQSMSPSVPENGMNARAWGGYLRRPRHVVELISSLAERSGVQSDISDDRKVPSIVWHTWHAQCQMASN